MGLTRAFAPEALSPLGNWSLWADLRPHPRPLPRAPYSPHFLLCHSGLSCSCQIGRFTGRGSFLGAETHSPEGEDPVLRRATHQPGAVLGFLQGQRSIFQGCHPWETLSSTHTHKDKEGALTGHQAEVQCRGGAHGVLDHRML